MLVDNSTWFDAYDMHMICSISRIRKISDFFKYFFCQYNIFFILQSWTSGFLKSHTLNFKNFELDTLDVRVPTERENGKPT